MNATDAHGCTPLIVAARSNQVGVVELLLEAGADVHAKSHLDEKEETALRIAVENGNADLIALLKKHGAKE